MKKLLSLTLGGFLWTAGALAQTCPTTISTFPHLQDFETSTAGSPGTLPTGWTISPTTSYRWQVEDGPTTSSNTGPDADHTTGVTGGKYIYTESSSGSTGSTADLISPCINISSLTTPGFDFWYHMYGATTGSMQVQVSSNNGTTWTTLFTLTGQQQNAMSDPWIKKTVSLSGYTGTIQIRFRGNRGTSFTSDMAIDDVKFYNIPANDAAITAINAPVSPVVPGTSVPVQVTLKNFGGSPLTSASLGFSVNGTVVVNNYNFTGNLANNQASTPITIGNFNFPAGAHTIKAWSSNPNAATDGDMTNDTTSIQVVACTNLNGVYSIDKNNMPSATNFQSIAAAVQALNQCGISGPIVFNVVAGSGPYNEQVVLGSINGVSATNTITFNGNGNTISATPNSTDLGIITLNGTDHVKFDNFVLNLDAGATTGWGVQLLNNANNNTITNTTINLPTSITNSNVNGIIAGSTISAAGSNTNNSVFSNNIINGGYYGIRINGNSGASGASNNQILNNTIKDTYIYNIYLDDTDGTIVEGNNISRPSRASVSTFYGVYMTGVNKNLKIRKNKLHTPFGANPSATGTFYGFYTSSSDAPSGSENVFSNNVFYNVNTNGTVYAIYNYSSNGTYYFHNTIDLPQTTSTGTVRAFYQSSTASNIQFKNNLISLHPGISGNKHLMYFATTASGITSENNAFYITPGSGNTAHVGYYSGNKTTLADWKAANNNAFDQNSVFADPIYINTNTGNLRPNTVALDNKGQGIALVTDDITGATRNATTPDPGAYEFSVPANDVAVIAISGPESGCGLTANETVTVTIRNFGSATQTSIPLSYTLNNTPTGTGTWTGSLAPNATATFPFTQTANLASSGAYVIKAMSSLGTDTNPDNDTLSINIGNALLPALPVSFDFETPAGSSGAMQVIDRDNSNITESAAASNGISSTQGMIMDGVDNAGWVVPVGITSPWANNPDHFSAVYMCFTPNAAPQDSLILTFDLKQLYKSSHYNTNFRITVNGQQVGPTYNPPFGGYDSLGAQWQNIRIDLEQFKSLGNVEIGLESSVKEEYANGNGTANLVDNINVYKVANPNVGIKENQLQNSLVVFPNPSNGQFNLKVPATTRSYTVEVTDLTGKVVKQQSVKNNSGSEQLNLNNTAKGIYILKIASEGNVATRKLIVE